MPTWVCSKCGTKSEGRCRPPKCGKCGALKEQIKKEEAAEPKGKGK